MPGSEKNAHKGDFRDGKWSTNEQICSNSWEFGAAPRIADSWRELCFALCVGFRSALYIDLILSSRGIALGLDVPV